jgi:hypothetical protein
MFNLGWQMVSEVAVALQFPVFLHERFMTLGITRHVTHFSFSGANEKGNTQDESTNT